MLDENPMSWRNWPFKKSRLPWLLPATDGTLQRKVAPRSVGDHFWCLKVAVLCFFFWVKIGNEKLTLFPKPKFLYMFHHLFSFHILTFFEENLWRTGAEDGVETVFNSHVHLESYGSTWKGTLNSTPEISILCCYTLLCTRMSYVNIAKVQILMYFDIFFLWSIAVYIWVMHGDTSYESLWIHSYVNGNSRILKWRYCTV